MSQHIRGRWYDSVLFVGYACFGALAAFVGLIGSVFGIIFLLCGKSDLAPYFLAPGITSFAHVAWFCFVIEYKNKKYSLCYDMRAQPEKSFASEEEKLRTTRDQLSVFIFLFRYLYAGFGTSAGVVLMKEGLYSAGTLLFVLSVPHILLVVRQLYRWQSGFGLSTLKTL